MGGSFSCHELELEAKHAEEIAELRASILGGPNHVGPLTAGRARAGVPVAPAAATRGGSAPLLRPSHDDDDDDEEVPPPKVISGPDWRGRMVIRPGTRLEYESSGEELDIVEERMETLTLTRYAATAAVAKYPKLIAKPAEPVKLSRGEKETDLFKIWSFS